MKSVYDIGGMPFGISWTEGKNKTIGANKSTTVG
jgi:hypothetical protein